MTSDVEEVVTGFLNSESPVVFVSEPYGVAVVSTEKNIQFVAHIVRHLRIGKVVRHGRRGSRTYTFRPKPPSQSYKRKAPVKPSKRK